MSCFILVLILDHAEGCHELNIYLVAFINMRFFWERPRSFFSVLQSGVFFEALSRTQFFLNACSAVTSP